MNGDGTFISWETAVGRGAVTSGEAAFRRVLDNCKAIPEVGPPAARLPLFLEGSVDGGPPQIWQFTVPAERLTEAWVPFLDRNSPDRAFIWEGTILRPVPWNCPGPHTTLSRVIVGSPGQSKHKIFLGPWHDSNPITQFQWADGTDLVDSSTAQLRLLQVHQTSTPHSALSK